MRKILFILLLLPFFGIGQNSCHVFGSVKFVDFGEDYKVKFVDFGEDLNVKFVDFGATEKGKWKTVNFGERYKIKIVDFGEDFKVKIVDFGHGCNSVGGSSSQNNSDRYKLKPYISQYVDNYDVLIAQIKNNQYNNASKTREVYQSKAKELYNTHKKNPPIENIFIPDGWYRVIYKSISNSGISYGGIVYERKVKVNNNYIIEIWTRDRNEALCWGNSSAQIFSPWKKEKNINKESGYGYRLPVKIDNNGFAKATTNYKGNPSYSYSFIFHLTNPESRVEKPIAGGNLSIWTDLKKCTDIKFYIKEFSMETNWWSGFKKYFPNGSPICGQDGTLIQDLEPGTYTIYAVTEGRLFNKKWGVKVTIAENGCQLIKITDDKWKL
tara:strand:+ start:339 stop:1481 length:1143 start_codon:yes stop_codon:yes gene_type:complete